MIHLDFCFSDEWNSKNSSSEIRLWDAIDIRYRAALGNLIFEIDDVDFSAKWGWIPLIDVAISFVTIQRALTIGETNKEVFEYTESDATLTFERNFDMAIISASYNEGSAQANFNELSASILAFAPRVFGLSIEKFPELKINRKFNELHDQFVIR